MHDSTRKHPNLKEDVIGQRCVLGQSCQICCGGSMVAKKIVGFFRKKTWNLWACLACMWFFKLHKVKKMVICASILVLKPISCIAVSRIYPQSVQCKDFIICHVFYRFYVPTLEDFSRENIGFNGKISHKSKISPFNLKSKIPSAYDLRDFTF